MSDFWKPPDRNQRQRELAYANACYYDHESFCGCGDFSMHLLSIVHSFTRGNTERSIRQILTHDSTKLCLTSGDAHSPPIFGDAGEENQGIDGLDGDELERLFSEDDGGERPPKDVAG